jgi:hypothetical protein
MRRYRHHLLPTAAAASRHRHQPLPGPLGFSFTPSKMAGEPTRTHTRTWNTRKYTDDTPPPVLRSYIRLLTARAAADMTSSVSTARAQHQAMIAIAIMMLPLALLMLQKKDTSCKRIHHTSCIAATCQVSWGCASLAQRLCADDLHY